MFDSMLSSDQGSKRGKDRVTTNLENLEKSGNLKVVREKSGKIGKVKEYVFLPLVSQL